MFPSMSHPKSKKKTPRNWHVNVTKDEWIRSCKTIIPLEINTVIFTLKFVWDRYFINRNMYNDVGI